MDTRLTDEQLESLRASVTPTDDDIRNYITYVMEHGKNRARFQGNLFNEVDYLMGALTAFFFFNRAGATPASWVFSPAAGKSVFNIENSPGLQVKELTRSLFKLIEAIELWGKETPDHWPHDTAALDEARRVYEKVTGERWSFPGRPENSPLWWPDDDDDD